MKARREFLRTFIAVSDDAVAQLFAASHAHDIVISYAEAADDGLAGCSAEVRGSDDLLHLDQRVVGIERLLLPGVNRGTPNLALFESLDQSLVIDDSAARLIDDDGVGLHYVELLLADKTAGILGQRAVQGDDVGLAQQSLEINASAVQLLFKLLGHRVRIVVQEVLALPALKALENHAADIAAADDADDLVAQLVGVVTPGPAVPLALLAAAVDHGEAAHAGQHQCDGELCGGGGVLAVGVADGDALLLCILEVNMVVTGCGDMDELQVLCSVHLVLADLMDGGENVIRILEVALLAVLDRVEEAQVELRRAKLCNEGLHTLGRKVFAIKYNIIAHVFSLLFNFLFFHCAGFKITLVPGKRFGEIVRGVLACGSRQSVLVILAQHRAVIRMSAVLDKQLGALLRSLPAQVGNTLLGYNDGHIVLCLVNVGNHGHDAGYQAVFCGGFGGEDADAGVAGEVAAAADAVEHLAAHLVRGVYVAVDIDLDGRVQRDDAETADDLRMVGYLLRADDHLVAVLVDILEEAFAAVGGKRDGACGDKVNNALVDEREGRVLHDLGVHRESLEAGCRQNAQNSVADGADAGLYRAGIGGEPSGGDLVLEELYDVFADLLRRGSDGLELLGRVKLIGHYNGRDLLRRAGHVGCANAVARVGDVYDAGVGRDADLEDVVHAHKSHRDGGVDLGDDETRVVHGGVGAARGGAEVQAVLGEGDALDDRNINALKGLLVEIHREVRNVNVAEGYAAVIDRGAQILVGLVAEALFHASRADERAVAVVTDRCADQNGQILGVPGRGERAGHGLRIADAGEAAEADGHAALDELRGLFGGHYLAFKGSCYSFH